MQSDINSIEILEWLFIHSLLIDSIQFYGLNCQAIQQGFTYKWVVVKAVYFATVAAADAAHVDAAAAAAGGNHQFPENVKGIYKTAQLQHLIPQFNFL